MSQQTVSQLILAGAGKVSGPFPSGPGQPAQPQAAGAAALKPDAFRHVTRTKPGGGVDAFAAKPEKPSPSRVAGQGAAFYNPFARSQAPARADAPVQDEAPGDRSSDDKISRDGASGAGWRKLANGAALRLVSSKRVAARAAQARKVEDGRLLRMGGGAAMWVGSTSVDAAAADADAPKVDAATGFDAAAVAADDYYGQGAPRMYSKPDAKPDVKSGGGGEPPPAKARGARKSDAGKSENAKPDNARGFDQDDLTGLMIAIGLLFLLGWIWLQGRGGQTEEEAAVSPQLAANEPEAPAALADPFGPGPVDLRPDSPMPEALPPEPVQQAEVEPAPAIVAPAVVAAAPVAPAVAAAPPTQSASVVSGALGASSGLRAYFCTESSGLTPAARTQLETDLVAWKARVGAGEVVVTGFADTRGATDFNAQLSELRADFVADVLRAHGLVVTEAVGAGELDSLDDERNCPHQRRVDIALKGAALSSPSRACMPPQGVAPLACG